jgi:hypothetical protein
MLHANPLTARVRPCKPSLPAITASHDSHGGMLRATGLPTDLLRCDPHVVPAASASLLLQLYQFPPCHPANTPAAPPPAPSSPSRPAPVRRHTHSPATTLPCHPLAARPQQQRRPAAGPIHAASDFTARPGREHGSSVSSSSCRATAACRAQRLHHRRCRHHWRHCR